MVSTGWDGRVDRDAEGRLRLPGPTDEPAHLHVVSARPGRCVLSSLPENRLAWCLPTAVASRGRFRLPPLADLTFGVPHGAPVVCLTRSLATELQVVLVDLQYLGDFVMQSGRRARVADSVRAWQPLEPAPETTYCLPESPFPPRVSPRRC